MTPGGLKPFEHQWGRTEAFAFRQDLGKQRIAGRIRTLSRQLKEGLSAMEHVRVVTPLDEEVSAGIACFEVDGLPAPAVVERLAERSIVATTTPYAVEYRRRRPTILQHARRRGGHRAP